MFCLSDHQIIKFQKENQHFFPLKQRVNLEILLIVKKAKDCIGEIKRFFDSYNFLKTNAKILHFTPIGHVT